MTTTLKLIETAATILMGWLARVEAGLARVEADTRRRAAR